jgi:DMSO/TMAO reductase YedYZ molybdopterin-dependent catalytic subunit
MIGKFFRKEPDNPRVPPGQAVTERFPVLTYGPTPRVTKEAFELRVFGLAAERSFDWQALMALPQTTLPRDFHCVTRWSKLGVSWTGVLVRDLMAELEVDAAASHVLFHCYGGYTTNLALDDFLVEDAMLAHSLEGEDIPVEHGGPLRSLIPHLYAWKSAKWLSGIEFMAGDRPGFWERNGCHNRGAPWLEERYS